MTTAREQILSWLDDELPRSWFSDVEVTVDKDEILVVGTLEPVGDEPDEACIARFREQTRDSRVAIARRAKKAFRMTVSWGARCGPTRTLFTTVSVPAMTRLRMQERQVLDTLIDAGVARSRSDALAWCVRMVAANEEEWLSELREAFEAVERVRAKGPAAESPPEH